MPLACLLDADGGLCAVTAGPASDLPPTDEGQSVVTVTDRDVVPGPDAPWDRAARTFVAVVPVAPAPTWRITPLAFWNRLPAAVQGGLLAMAAGTDADAFRARGLQLSLTIAHYVQLTDAATLAARPLLAGVGMTNAQLDALFTTPCQPGEEPTGN